MANVEVLLATSSDPEHPAEAIVDGKPDTFWATTGLFPQEVVFGVPAHISVSCIIVKTAGVTKIAVKGSHTGDKYFDVTDQELADTGNQVQTTELRVNTESARYLKIILEEGTGLFAAIYSVNFLDV